jgi:hypothetical protein
LERRGFQKCWALPNWMGSNAIPQIVKDPLAVLMF